jgi:hypothetical protein
MKESDTTRKFENISLTQASPGKLVKYFVPAGHRQGNQKKIWLCRPSQGKLAKYFVYAGIARKIGKKFRLRRHRQGN